MMMEYMACQMDSEVSFMEEAAWSMPTTRVVEYC